MDNHISYFQCDGCETKISLLRDVWLKLEPLGHVCDHCRRVGKPRANWLIETCQDAYAKLNPHVIFDINNLGCECHGEMGIQERAPFQYSLKQLLLSSFH